MNRIVLFICTGNYYRSRFAEACFNHRARDAGLPWEACSRGLRIDAVTGDLSIFTERAMEVRAIPRSLTAPGRRPLVEADLAGADLVIAMSRDEHYPLMESRFPRWAGRIRYWMVHDIDIAMPDQALAEMEREVLALVESLGRGAAREGVSGALAE